VEHGAVVEPAGVVHDDLVVGLGLAARTDHEVLDEQATFELALLHRLTREGFVAAWIRQRRLSVDELELEGQARVRRDLALLALAVRKLCGDRQPSLAADLHARHTEIPPLDHTALADRERVRALALL